MADKIVALDTLSETLAQEYLSLALTEQWSPGEESPAQNLLLTNLPHKNQPPPQPTTLETLPREILIHSILPYLSLRTLFTLATTSRLMRTLVLDNKVLFRTRLFDYDSPCDRERYRVDNSYLFLMILTRLGPRARSSITRLCLDDSLITDKIILSVFSQLPFLEELSVRRCRLLTADDFCSRLRDSAEYRDQRGFALKRLNISGFGDNTIESLIYVEQTLRSITLLKHVVLDVAPCAICGDYKTNETLTQIGPCIKGHPIGRVCERCEDNSTCMGACGKTMCRKCCMTYNGPLNRFGFCMTCVRWECSCCGSVQVPMIPTGKECACSTRKLCRWCDVGTCEGCGAKACSMCCVTWGCTVCKKVWCSGCEPTGEIHCQNCAKTICKNCSIMRCAPCGVGYCGECMKENVPVIGSCDNCMNLICSHCFLTRRAIATCMCCGFVRCEDCLDAIGCYHSN